MAFFWWVLQLGVCVCVCLFLGGLGGQKGQAYIDFVYCSTSCFCTPPQERICLKFMV